MEFITRHLFLFFLGGIGGWIIELFFRRIVHKRWINPGFLTGPCLPLYGSGLCLLYFFSSLDYSFIPSTIGQKIFCIVIMTALVVLLEYLTGLYFLKVNHVRLWDYSDRWGNIQGIICPLFSVFWLAIAGGYYFLLHPSLVKLVQLVMNTPYLFLFEGFASGIFIIDFIMSIQLVNRLRTFAKEHKLDIAFENLKENIQKKRQERKEKRAFLFPFRLPHTILKEMVENYLDKKKEERKESENKGE